jgi:ABC-type proline/glycine betaine transport system permease subunit
LQRRAIPAAKLSALWSGFAAGGFCQGMRGVMKNMFSQIVVGVIVTVVGALATNAIMHKMKRSHAGAPSAKVERR